MLRPFDADDNVEKYRTFAESFRGLAKAARKARIICRSAAYSALWHFLKKVQKYPDTTSKP